MSIERSTSSAPDDPGAGSSGPKARITVVNDFPVVVAGLAAVLARHSDEFLVMRAAAGTVPAPGVADIVLYDVFAQSGTIEDFVSQTKAKVVVFTAVLEAQAVVNALRAGVAGYIYKGVSIAQLVTALMDIHHGTTPVVDLKPDPGSVAAAQHWPGQDHDLTEREAEVLALICRGRNNQEIAAQLHLSLNSVKTYIRMAYRKMGVDSRTKAVVWGIDRGFGTSSSITP